MDEKKEEAKDPKGLAVIIASKMKEKNGEKDTEKAEGNFKELAGMLMKSAKADDQAAFAKDLKSFIKLCMSE